MSHQHTPGPWEVVYRDDENSMCMTVIAPKGSMEPTNNAMRLVDDPNMDKVIAITFHQLNPYAGWDACREDKEEANANLIAAAPELLDALAGLLSMVERIEGEHVSWPKDCYEKCEMARTAIAKARGGA